MSPKEYDSETLARIAEIRARHPRNEPPTPPPVAPKRPKMVDAESALREIVWEQVHAEGLTGELLCWMQDEAVYSGTPIPDRLEFSPRAVELGACLLIEKRAGDHPWLRQTDALDLDCPVWSETYPCPGLALQPASNSLRSQIIIACGIGRLMAPIVHPPMTNSPREYRRWLIPIEVFTYFEENHF